MLSTPTVLAVALETAALATRTYTIAVATLSPTARRWDEIAGQLTVAADLLSEQRTLFASRVGQLRARAVDASARAQRQRAIAAMMRSAVDGLAVRS